MADPHANEGFTLIELLVAVTILGIVVVALAGSFLVALGQNEATQKRLSDSHDAQQLALYLPADVQSASTDPAVSATNGCASASPNKLVATWTDDSGVSTISATYAMAAASSGTGYDFVRTLATSTATLSTDYVVRNLTDPCGVVISQPSTGLTTIVVNEPSGDTYTVTASRRTP